MSDERNVVQSQDEADRGLWVRPEVRRISAGEAEAVGASGNDNVIGTS